MRLQHWGPAHRHIKTQCWDSAHCDTVSLQLWGRSYCDTVIPRLSAEDLLSAEFPYLAMTGADPGAAICPPACQERSYCSNTAPAAIKEHCSAGTGPSLHHLTLPPLLLYPERWKGFISRKRWMECNLHRLQNTWCKGAELQPWCFKQLSVIRTFILSLILWMPSIHPHNLGECRE